MGNICGPKDRLIKARNECASRKCHNYTINKNKYCVTHMCNSVRCMHEATNGNIYCDIHKCYLSTCRKPVYDNNSIYCREHSSLATRLDDDYNVL